jgi:hypothetical protein
VRWKYESKQDLVIRTHARIVEDVEEEVVEKSEEGVVGESVHATMCHLCMEWARTAWTTH